MSQHEHEDMINVEEVPIINGLMNNDDPHSSASQSPPDPSQTAPFIGSDIQKVCISLFLQRANI